MTTETAKFKPRATAAKATAEAAPKTKTRSQEIATDVVALLRARNPLLWIISREEARVETHLFQAIAQAGYQPRTWDVAQGVAMSINGKPEAELADPDAVLNKIREEASQTADDKKRRGVWILRDLPPWLQGVGGVRTLRNVRNLARLLPGIPRDTSQAMIVLSPSGEVPPELTAHATVIDWPLPDRSEIGAMLDTTVKLHGERMVGSFLRNTREAAIDAAVGLTGEEADACFARSLVQHRRVDPKTISQEKKRIVAREGVLEWYDPIPAGLDAVGGLDNLKAWLTKRKLAFSPEAREFGLPAPKGVMLVGVPGCLHGDTPIYDPVARTTKTVAERSRAGKSFHVWSQHNGVPVIGLATPPYEYEEEPMLEITFDNGNAITVTPAHMFISDGKVVFASEVFARLQECELCLLETSSVLDLQARTASDLRSTQIVQGFLDDCLSGHPVSYGEQLLLEANTVRAFAPSQDDAPERNPMHSRRDGSDNSQERIRTCPGYDHLSTLRCSPQNNAQSRNAHPGLVPEVVAERHLPELGTSPAARQSDPGSIPNGIAKQPAAFAPQSSVDAFSSRRYTRVRSVRQLPAASYYDFHVPGYENYWAVGVWNHNCGKSLMAKVTSTAWNVPLLRMDLGALKDKYVGSSERNLRRALDVIAAIGRCVVWLDEIEKALAGATQGAADGGVSADALGSILSWMQERQGEAFVIATANDITTLPPELLRKGRFDEIWFVDMPNAVERVEVLKAALASHGRADVKVDFKKIATACEQFTGSEIAALVPDALFTAFDNGRDIQTSDILEAAKTVFPLAKTASEKITKLREWAKERARPATSPVATKATATTGHRDIDIGEED